MAERILFVTGKLAEPALRREVEALALKVGFTAEVVALPITVAALLTADWVRRKLVVPAGVGRVILPGLCRGELAPLVAAWGVPVELGPRDLRDLPSHFGKGARPPEGYGEHALEIVAEINHAPQLGLGRVLAVAEHYRESGADVIDLGCDPGGTWPGVAGAVAALVRHGFRVSIDSFDPTEVLAALDAGAGLVLSVNGSNARHAEGWHRRFPEAEVVAIPDAPADAESLDRTAIQLSEWGVPFRLDPILEPFGFGFTASVLRYADVRRRHPGAKMMMGVGNVTELTDADSAGVNVVLAGVCAELRIDSVLTTEVGNWARSSVRELDLARRLMHHATTQRTLPKYLEPRLTPLRGRKRPDLGDDGIGELAALVTDRNYRLLAERGELHAINRDMHLRGADPFALFEELAARDPKLDVGHAFYLGYEMAKAVTALTLGKNYTQDQALDWGFLTRPEVSRRAELGGGS